ncbi:DUF6600 domain-containing protein [Dokdonella sp.]|uniref:DUF6600 domain-containing protein n=1 Tax=Dokdonella sp. TaxID=2291710 RepID=UPI001B257D21|nr:DUF6600 domain-containing protein [Dokdonella sp.]MBO9664630.1 hypothetical protein [Dokdonella sp.]
MVITRHSIFRVWYAAATLAFALFAGNALADVDPPDRVARVSFLRGNVSFQPAGDDQWAEISLNRPVVTGDKVYADRDSRAELQIGAADIRLDEGSTFNLLNLDDNIAQIELTEGTLNLHVRRVLSGQSYEIDTPTLAFVVDRPGDYRIDISPQGDSTMVTVFDGAGDVYGENNASYSVRAGNAYKFHDSALRDYETFDLPRRDDFDQWCSSRNDRYERSVSSRYVSDEVIGYADLDDYGSWSEERDYGSVWYPTSVEAGWTPYRSGHWSWVDPWGWSWVDASPWGFAPFHYGRWAYIGNRWGWCPGARRLRPVYAPALVGFVGGSGWGVSVNIGGGGPVGWFPLGPRDVYVPWYRASRNYFTNVNVRNTTIINNTYITNVYNDYSRGRPIRNMNYAYRTNVNAVTAVPRDAFIGSRAVAASRVQINEANLRNAQVVSRVGIAPERASFAATAGRGRPAPAAALDRRVIARTAPPAQAAPIASRIQAIQRNDAQPLARNQLRELAPARPGATAGRAAPPSRVQVVGQNARNAPQPLPMRGNAATQRAGDTGNDRGAPNTPPARGNATPPSREAINAPRGDARGQPGRGQPDQSTTPADRAGALPSSRFSPRANPAGDNRAPVSQPPARGATDTPNRSVTPANPRPTPDAGARGNTRDGALPSSRFSPRSQQTPNEPRTQPQQAPRSTPSFDRGSTQTPRNAPQPRTQPVPQQPRNTQPRSAPAQEQRSMPRTERAPQPQYQPRSAPQPQYQQRSAPVQEQRSMPRMERAPQPQSQPRSAPQPQYQPRNAPAPQQRSMPQPQQQRSAPPQQQQRAQPPQRNRDGKDNDRDRR